ncbi:vascular endothelial growth factor A-like [Ptychodera flava]|uniref:vascular endothelial growth factor A-like n=1 Tax=Ptychodera flava TaxID=63121 RepID=UPI003969FE41
MAEIRLLLLSLAGFFAVTTTTPLNVFGTRRLLVNPDEEAPSYRLDQASKATTIEDVLRILFPDREPADVWQELTVERDVLNNEARLGQSVVTRPATSDDLFQIQNQVDESQCSIPINVTVDAYQELGYEKGLGTHLWPDCVTVPRCHSQCGCCGEGQICSSTSDSKVEIQKMFYVFTESDSHVAIKNITAHTYCTCQADVGGVPISSTLCPPPQEGCSPRQVWDDKSCACKCAKMCPEPYLQDPYTCECDCLHSNKACGKVKRGQRRLPDAGCQCVESNDCDEPTCKYGLFDMIGCRCPPS